MFAKPFKLLLIYLLTIVNVVFLITPVVASLAPFFDFTKNGVVVDYSTYQKIKIAIFFLIFSVSFLMLFYLFIDFVFGFSLRSSLKNCKRFDKIKAYDFLGDIFKETQEKFNARGVKLYVRNSDEINAYAVASMSSGAIVISRGLIDHYLISSQDPNEFLMSLRSIMGHEMSHLINRDFLPTFFVICNEKATNLVSKIIHYIFFFQINFFNKVPFIGAVYSSIIFYTYSIINFILTIFNKYVVMVIYNFLNKFASRSIEFRCDYQSALAFGGTNMINALTKLGSGGYFSIFSTHPNIKDRINNVKFVNASLKNISPRFLDKLSNYLATMILITICLYFAKQANVDDMVRNLLKNHEFIYRKISYLWRLVKQIY